MPRRCRSDAETVLSCLCGPVVLQFFRNAHKLPSGGYDFLFLVWKKGHGVVFACVTTGRRVLDRGMVEGPSGGRVAAGAEGARPALCRTGSEAESRT